MKKLLALALVLSFPAANGGWLLDKVKSGATKVKNAAKRVHNSSAATKLRSKAKSGLKRVGSAVKKGATKATAYVKNKFRTNMELPAKIISTIGKLRQETEAIEDSLLGKYDVSVVTAGLIMLCKECEANPIKVMKSLNDISNYIKKMEELTDETGLRIIPPESTDVLLGYMRDLNNLVYEYSLPYMNNIKKMLNEAIKIQENAEGEEILSCAKKLAKISDDCLKDTEYLEENIDIMAMLISELQARGVDITTLSTCLMNLRNLISSMQTLIKFKATGENLAQTAKTTATNLEQTASMSATTLVNSANSAVLQSTELVNQGIQSSTEKLAEGIDSAMDYTQDAVNKSTEYLNDSANKLNQGMEDLSEKVGDSANNLNRSIEASSQNMANKLGELTSENGNFDELPPYSPQEEPLPYEQAVSVEAN